MRTVITIALAVLFSVPAQAMPRFVKSIGHAINTHKLLIAEVATVEAAAIADDHETISALQRCPSCAEWNPLLPNHPSRAEVYGESAATTSALAAGNWYLLKLAADPEMSKKWWRIASLGTTAEYTGLHIYGTIRNNQIH